MERTGPEPNHQHHQHAGDVPPTDRPTGPASYRMFVGLRNMLDDALDNVVDPDTRAWIEGQINRIDHLLGIIA